MDEQQRLVTRLAGGDGAAWHQFIVDYGRIIRARVADVAITFGRGSDDSAIDDAVAEVFAVLLANEAAALRSFAGRSSLGTYLAVIATRSSMRTFARLCEGVSSTHTIDSAATCGQDRSCEPLSQLIQAEDECRVRDLIEKLPEKQRQLVDLFYLQGCSYTEINERLQVPIGSIGVTLRRAEAKLRQWLEAPSR